MSSFEYDMVVEIPYQSNIKYELDHQSNQLRCDRILHTSMSYPGNYGFIPNTLAGDGDPLDSLLLSEYPLHPNTWIRGRVVGVLETEDEKGMDEKILMVPSSKVDPFQNSINDLEDLNPLLLSKIKHFFQHYKDQEKNKWVQVKSFENKKRAAAIIKRAKRNCSTPEDSYLPL